MRRLQLSRQRTGNVALAKGKKKNPIEQELEGRGLSVIVRLDEIKSNDCYGHDKEIAKHESPNCTTAVKKDGKYFIIILGASV